MPPGVLYVVATPLGNPDDLSPRAVQALKSASLVMAEDTRTARALLRTCQLDRPTRSCFDANELARAEETAAALADGRDVALVSEAGTPSVSDPGYKVIRAAIASGARVVPVPGPAAFLLALVGSGLPTSRFFFAGFPPRTAGARRAFFAKLAAIEATLLFYESPRRTAETLADLGTVLGQDRQACVARELTKIHEEFVRGSLGTLAALYADKRPLGEITLVVEGSQKNAHAALASEIAGAAARAAELLAEGLSPRDASARLAHETGLPRTQAYRLVLGAVPGTK
jgi:16S rRNA (cytidine1402-2'-O)-methyltransferase